MQATKSVLVQAPKSVPVPVLVLVQAQAQAPVLVLVLVPVQTNTATESETRLLEMRALAALPGCPRCAGCSAQHAPGAPPYSSPVGVAAARMLSTVGVTGMSTARAAWMSSANRVSRPACARHTSLRARR